MVALQIDPESAQIREVYARFGLAMYQAQCLERQLAIILATKYGPSPSKMSRTEFDNLLEDFFSKSFGQLVSSIAKLSALSQDEEEQLRKALEKRNWLAHRYFWERAADFLTESGRDSMLNELQEIADLFDRLDEFFTSKTVDWANSVGISQEMLNQQLERLLKDQGVS